AHDAALDDDAVLVKRCGYFFSNWSSRSHVNSGPLLEFHRRIRIVIKEFFKLVENYEDLVKDVKDND
ncbi:hypothetical protein Tco_0666849, partial [Tanacetum coccineum]